MILGDPTTASGKASRVTLDDMFRRAAQRRPDDLALIDPDDRARIAGGAPRALTFAEADRVISAIAARLRAMGLPADSIVGIQLPNTVESVLTLLGVVRAGMIAAPLPALWRRADAVAALGRLDAKAIITCARIGDADHGDLAMHIAADIFTIRYVCGFGDRLPDGIVPFDNVFSADPGAAPPPTAERAGNPAAHVAVITFEVTPDGVAPVARSHNELLAAGLAVVMESRFEPDAAILSTLPVSSFAGLGVTLMSWLLIGGALTLHQPFDAEALSAQIRSRGCRSVILPAAVAMRLAEAGRLSAEDGLACVLALWRAPERMPLAPDWTVDGVGLVDVPVFGESALFAARRGDDGRPLSIPSGRIGAPRGVTGALPVLEVARSAAGTVTVRGPMVPRRAFPGGAEGHQPFYKVAEDGFVDTAYPCRPAGDSLVVTGPPPGIVSVGGYRFVLDELQALIRSVDDHAALAALPDPLAGQRLAGNAPDRLAVQQALAARGVSPLVIGAFRERRAMARSADPAVKVA